MTDPGNAALAARRSISKKYRDGIWKPFIGALKDYHLIEPGDKIAVCVSGGKDSFLCAVLMKMLQGISETPFELEFLTMDPGYAPQNRNKLEENAALLDIPLTVFETNVFDVAYKTEHSPCYLCARMRRGHLYSEARRLGCNKIALGHHKNDVIETAVMSMFYASQLQCMPPKLRSTNFPGMQLIRPLYKVAENNVKAWARYNGLEFLRCACRFTEAAAEDEKNSKRLETKNIIAELKKTNPNIENSIFNAVHSVCLDTFPSYKTRGRLFTFNDIFESRAEDLSTDVRLESDR
ncbi:MAG: tRNA 2-thiocytidine biosynthesis TtcA family protein [Clostridia bacterium]|nr:tRNA 2-thiocytidine biosynthesis TtcA family protein [Clostridia bacterium]